jgi:hypothetical protein
MSEWFCRAGNQVLGPFTWSELTYLAQRGKLTARDLVREGKSGNWRTASSVAGLLAAPSAMRTHSRAEIDATGLPVKSSLPTPVGAAGTQQRDTANGSAAQALPDDSAINQSSNLVPRAVLKRGGPPSLTRLSQRDDDARRRWIIAASISFGIVLLLLLLLLLFSMLNTRNGGGGAASGSGSGKAGSGKGPGSESGTGAGKRGHSDEATDKNELSPEKTGDGTEKDGDGVRNSTEGQDSRESTALTNEPPPGKNFHSAGDAPATAGASKSGNSRFAIGGSEFFGITSAGNSFIYIVDCSGSMLGERLEKAKHELLRSIYGLDDDKTVFVIFFADTHFSMFYPGTMPDQLLPSNLPNKQRIQKWVESFSVSGGTVPDSAIRLALQMQPDAIYLLTDGGFNASAVQIANQLNLKRIPIHTIGFQDSGGETNLKQIAADSAGTYKFVP